MMGGYGVTRVNELRPGQLNFFSRAIHGSLGLVSAFHFLSAEEAEILPSQMEVERSQGRAKSTGSAAEPLTSQTVP